MATGGGAAGGQCSDSAGSEDLTELKCQPCHEDGRIREAVGICLDCQDYLCQKCFDSHTIPRPCKNHQLLDKREMIKSQVQLRRKDECVRKCSVHDDCVVKHYCIGHGQIACDVCLSADHRTCKAVKFIPTAVKRLDSNAEFKQAELCLNSTLLLCLRVSDIESEELKSIASNCAEAMEALDTHRRNVNDAFDRIQAGIAEQADVLAAESKEKLVNITDKSVSIQREVQEVKSQTEKYKKAGLKCELYTEMMAMNNRLAGLEGEMTAVEREMTMRTNDVSRKFRFKPNHELLEASQDMFGKLTLSEDELTQEFEHVQAINVKTSSNDKTCWITGSTFLSDNELVCADRQNTSIKAISVTRNRVNEEFGLSSKPWDICKIQTNQLVVSSPDARTLTFIQMDGNMSLERTIYVGGKCFGIDFKNDKLAVSFSDPHKVQILSLNGTLLNELATSQTGLALFSSPYYLMYDRSGSDIYVSNHGSNNIVRLKIDGTIVDKYSDRELRNPKGLVTDSDGNVYACGCGSHTIQKISRDATQCRVLLRHADGLNLPQTISYCEPEKMLYVAMQTNNVMKAYTSTCN